MRRGVRGQLLIPVTLVVCAFVVFCFAISYRSAQRERVALSTRLDDISRTLDHANFPLTRGVLEQMHGLTGADFFVLADGSTLTTLPDNPQLADLTHARSTVPSDPLGTPVN